LGIGLKRRTSVPYRATQIEEVAYNVSRSQES